jgi:hypothetical protein
MFWCSAQNFGPSGEVYCKASFKSGLKTSAGASLPRVYLPHRLLADCLDFAQCELFSERFENLSYVFFERNADACLCTGLQLQTARLIGRYQFGQSLHSPSAARCLPSVSTCTTA